MPQFKFNTISRVDIERSTGGNHMIAAIDYDGPNHLFVTGVPGSGKTTVTIMRAERLIALKKDVMIFTFQNLLKTSLINIASEDLKNNIKTFYKWYSNKFNYLNQSDDDAVMIEAMKDWSGCDEILIDEGQNSEQRIYRSLLTKCKQMTAGADNAQKIHANGLKSGEIEAELKRNKDTAKFKLEYNYRNTFEIYNFARHFMPDNERANNQFAIDKIPKGLGEKPVVFQARSNDESNTILRTLLTNAGDKNVAVLVYHTREVDSYYQRIRNMGLSCTKHHTGSHADDNIENILVTTYKSAQGLEFQVVIMPSMETAMNSEEKTKEHYYIGCTRAKENLYLLYEGESLPNCLSAFNAEAYTHMKSENRITPKPNDDLPF